MVCLRDKKSVIQLHALMSRTMLAQDPLEDLTTPRQQSDGSCLSLGPGEIRPALFKERRECFLRVGRAHLDSELLVLPFRRLPELVAERRLHQPLACL